MTDAARQRWEDHAERMVREQLEDRGIRDPRVLAAMRSVPRHAFMPDASVEAAYADHAMPTAEGQTISQPYIVAKMTELLAVEPGMRVLEVGCGSGYQSAVLLEMGAEVVGVERHAGLAEAARTRLTRRYDPARFTVIEGDGSMGCEAHAPYDRILVTAAAPRPPLPLRRQLADPGRLVIPLGDRTSQRLTVMDLRDGQWTRSDNTPCRFVPLLGEHGFEG